MSDDGGVIPSYMMGNIMLQEVQTNLEEAKGLSVHSGHWLSTCQGIEPE